ncbi:MAG: methyltransferase domain-containing protein [Myxococcota bacterium]|nr:methyltransferase domain-containing protein [Myxococcota bacterium]
MGAGTGSYEPANRNVIAIEPSSLMLTQHTSGSVRIRGTAESIPLRSDCVEAAMTILTLHHWSDWKRGLSEMHRISRGPTVVLTHDPIEYDFWLLDYFPILREMDRDMFPTVEEIAEECQSNGWDVKSIAVPVPHDCTDGFLGAYWQRPKPYFLANVRRSISTFNLLEEQLLKEALNQLRRDLESGTWEINHGHLRELTELDIGYRILKMTSGA